MVALVGVSADAEQEGAAAGDGGIPARRTATIVGPGVQNGSKLLVEIRKLGYVGSYTLLSRFLQPWRDEKGAAKRMEIAATQSTEGNYSAVSAMRAVSAQEAAAALSKPKPMFNERQGKIVEF